MAMEKFRFATAINCIDGRTQEPVINTMKRSFDVDGVDMVTFPGADGIFSKNASEGIELIRRAVAISVEKHGSKVIAVVGHHDCAGNPGDMMHHHDHIRKAMEVVSSWNLPVQVVGYYVNERWETEKVK